MRGNTPAGFGEGRLETCLQKGNALAAYSIILRPVSWHEAPFGKLQALPRNGQPISTWSDRDQAFFSVVDEIERIVEKNERSRGRSSTNDSTRDTVPKRKARRTPEKRWANILVLVIIIALVGIAVSVFAFSPLGSRGAIPTLGPSTFPPKPASNLTALPTLLSTPAVEQQLYQQITSTSPLWSDVLAHDGSSQANWAQIPGCSFTSNAYLVQTTYSDYCLANKPTYCNFAFEIEMTITQGNVGGIVFRATDPNQLYYFHISTEGIYTIGRTLDENTSTANHISVFRRQSSSTIKTSLNQINRVAVLANGKGIDFFINGQYIDHVNDQVYACGHIGVDAGEYGESNPTTVAFNNARVWAFST